MYSREGSGREPLRFSIYGDSISTLHGYQPRDYAVYYEGGICRRSGVYAVQDTWWGMVIDHFGGELLVNDSWSGCLVSRQPFADCDFPSGCSVERIERLHRGDRMPDVILVYMGTNDWGFGAPLAIEGRGKYSPDVPGLVEGFREGDQIAFSVAMRQITGRLRLRYPEARIFCCTICETVSDCDPGFRFPSKLFGSSAEEFNQVTRQAAAETGCGVIELFDGKTRYESFDGIHPTRNGMRTIAEAAVRELERQGLSC